MKRKTFNHINIIILLIMFIGFITYIIYLFNPNFLKSNTKIYYEPDTEQTN